MQGKTMNTEHLMEATKIGLTTIQMADTKAWVCIAITMGVFAGTFSAMEKHSATMSRLLWMLGNISYLLMGLGILIGVWVTFARGGVVNAGHGPGLVDPRRIHLWHTEAEFSKQVGQARPEQFTNDWENLAFDYSTIMDMKFFWLTVCQMVSTLGWCIASISVVLVQIAVRNDHKYVQTPGPVGDATVALNGKDNGQAAEGERTLNGQTHAKV
jgi:hypothetical protein